MAQRAAIGRSASADNAGTVDVDGVSYDWHLQPKRLSKGLPRGRLQLDDATISRCARRYVGGWEPMSRGTPMVFIVDADGN